MASVFWDAHGILFIDYLEKGNGILCACVVVAYCNRRMRSSSVQGFVSTVPTLYEEEDEEEEEDYAPLYRNRRMRSSIFTLCSSVS